MVIAHLPDKAKVYMLLGDGGSATSPGFEAFGHELKNLGHEVYVAFDSGRNGSAILADMHKEPLTRKLALFGYSLGAWYCPYIAAAIPTRNIALVIGWDPARKKTTPVGKNVKRCICFRQSFPWSPLDWLVGGGYYTSAVDGPKIETIKQYDDHWLVQFNPTLHRAAIEALKTI